MNKEKRFSERSVGIRKSRSEAGIRFSLNIDQGLNSRSEPDRGRSRNGFRGVFRPLSQGCLWGILRVRSASRVCSTDSMEVKLGFKSHFIALLWARLRPKYSKGIE